MTEDNKATKIIGGIALAVAFWGLWQVLKGTDKKLDGVGLREWDVKVGDYLLLDTGAERAKIKVTRTKDKYGRTQIDGKVKVRGKSHSVAVLKSDFENGFVKKISEGTKVVQKFTSK